MTRAMRIIPVLDIKGGIVVHARRGRRADYEPLRSPLVDGCEPVAVARALCAAARTGSLYVADLDALAGAPVDVATLAALSAVAELWVDAGATTIERAAALARAGVARNVVGTESLGPAPASTGDEWRFTGGGCQWNAKLRGEPCVAATPALPTVLSVDLRDGRLIAQDPELAGRDPAAAAPLAIALGVREVLVIDLARVGTGSGPPLQAVAELATALPALDVYAGGGVRDDDDLRALEAAGAAGALLATALHEGLITPSPAPRTR
jgi:phosphoribosylformimino-5-aminoimidazole carboxamide ribotide isomerase